MSEEELKAFLTKVQGDKSLQDQLNAEGADPIAIAKAAGFSITLEDLKEHRQDLSDEDLEGVAGGNGTPSQHPSLGFAGRCPPGGC